MVYRREIDGLRALAVLSVLAFHFCPGVFPYGYLGVDLFFVISGFLISRYILEESDRNSFSFPKFYLRRIRRILPVTLSVLGVTLIVASGVLTGADFDRFLRSLIATVTFTANIFFWRDGGYFGTNDALKPLLHMWSLGVEEQFYLVFPVVFVLVLKWTRQGAGRLFAVALFSLLSLLGNYYLIASGGDNPAFFLAPFRVWQFGMGAVAALIHFHFPGQHGAKAQTLCALVLVSGLSIFPRLVSPGFLVVMATAFFLSRKYASQWIFSAFFSNSFVQKTGLVSFSLYLWHWPVLAFIRYVSIDNPSPVYAVSGALITCALSLLSYTFVEEPFRRKVRPATTVRWTLSATLLLLAAAAAALSSDFSRNGKDRAEIISQAIQTNYRCGFSEYIAYGGSRACLINRDLHVPYEVALVGNSHAQMYAPSIQDALRRRGQRGLLIPLNNCLPTIDLNVSPECLRLARLNFDAFMSDKDVKIVIFALTWYQSEWVKAGGETVRDPDRMAVSRSVLDLVGRVRESGREAYLVGPIQVPGYDLPSVLSRQLRFGWVSSQTADDVLRVPRGRFDADFREAMAFLGGALGDGFIRPSDELCDDRYCYFGDSEGVYFADSSHLSRAGATKVRRLFDFLGRK